MARSTGMHYQVTRFDKEPTSTLLVPELTPSLLCFGHPGGPYDDLEATSNTVKRLLWAPEELRREGRAKYR